MENVVAGDDPVRIKTRNFNLTLEKTLLESLGGNVVFNSETKFILPTLNEMGMSYDPNGTEKYSAVEIAVSLMKLFEPIIDKKNLICKLKNILNFHC